MLLPMHPKSVEKNITPNLIVSNQLDTIVSNFSLPKLPASPSVDSVAKTSPLMSSVLVVDSDPKYLVQYAYPPPAQESVQPLR